jgi:hypothetical protein
METNMKVISKPFIVGMSSAFDLFPQNTISKLPFQASIENGQILDVLALRGDMKKIGGDFQQTIRKIKSKSK